MAGQRKLMTRMVLIEGIALIKEVESFTQPNVKKIMQDTRGGSFIGSQVMVGIEKLTSKLTIKGATKETVEHYGASADDTVQVDVKESYEDEDGLTYSISHSMTGEVIDVSDGDSKQSELASTDMELALTTYKKTENGKTVYHIDRNAQILDLGKGDLLAEHRRNIGQP